jgi:hypothetical protein
MTRETDQLLKAANYYLAEAGCIISSRPRLEAKTIGYITRSHNTRGFSDGEIALAHLASAAVRLATICEINCYRPTENYRTKFYERSGKRKSNWPSIKIRRDVTNNLSEHLHLLLRDNVAHEEPGIKNNSDLAADRFQILKAITIGACEHALKKTVRQIKRSL